MQGVRAVTGVTGIALACIDSNDLFFFKLRASECSFSPGSCHSSAVKNGLGLDPPNSKEIVDVTNIELTGKK